MSRNTDDRRRRIKLGIFTSSRLSSPALLAAIMGNFGFGAEHRVQGRSSPAPACSRRATTSGSPASPSARSRRSRSTSATQARSPSRSRTTCRSPRRRRAEIRFLNLVGDRYLALEQGAARAPSGSSRRRHHPGRADQPALDLTALFNGFQPLFQALTPEEVNELSLNLVQVLQGEGGTVGSLLSTPPP